MTLSELGHWFIEHFKLDVGYRVIQMEGYERTLPRLRLADHHAHMDQSIAQRAKSLDGGAYAGTVMLVRRDLAKVAAPRVHLELFGAPDIDARAVIAEMHAIAPQWLKGCKLRDCWFWSPHSTSTWKRLCGGVQIPLRSARLL